MIDLRHFFKVNIYLRGQATLLSAFVNLILTTVSVRKQINHILLIPSCRVRHRLMPFL